MRRKDKSADFGGDGVVREKTERAGRRGRVGVRWRETEKEENIL